MSLLECKCAQPLWALGIPDCHPVLRPIRRVAFETNLADSNSPNAFDLVSSVAYTDARRLMTPTLYQVASERPEPVLEELSGTRFFVRTNPRTFTALVAKPPTEWGINIEQLRCKSRLGVFLIDEAGVVWARRDRASSAAPIPVDPATIFSRLAFPSDTTITKYEISFNFAQGFEDYELVPVWADKALLNYVPPIAARMEANSSVAGLIVNIYALYARGADFTEAAIPISGLASNIRVRNNSNSVVPTSFVEGPAGVYTDASFTFNPAQAPYTIDISPLPSSSPFDLTTAVFVLR